MPFILEVKEEARQDIADVMKWYASKVESLDKKFLKAVEETLFRIQKNPFAFKKIYKTFRQTSVRKFPYVILYKPEDKNVVIFSAFNTWQHPKKKFSRIRK
ncbi:MAG TPA: type II toxin-antitoxin system RelE/ParE family toxin [Chitinophagaceae bacterium]|nr:type II toxin-antitoxin system RelE/ParE family toxin [Chitinophagaceae bacterium]